MKKDAIIAALAFGGLKPVPTVDAQVVQSTGTSAAAVMSQKATTDALNQKQNAADPAGLADNLTPYSADSGATQTTPFIAQGTGCGNGENIVDTGSFFQFKKKLGNTVCVNQLLSASTYTSRSVHSYADYVVTFNGESTGNIRVFDNFPTIAGHTYLSFVTGAPSDCGLTVNFNASATSTIGKHYVIKQATTTLTSIDNNIGINVGTGVSYTWNNVKMRFAIIDISLWYGSNDNIPAHLLSHPEDWGRYYAGSLDYAVGYLDSADGTVMKSVGRQVWDEEYENAYYDNSGTKQTNLNLIGSKNLISVIPNAEYYGYCPATTTLTTAFFDANKNFMYRVTGVTGVFTIPSGCQFLSFSTSIAYGATYNHDITISLYYSGESGYDQYYPHTVLAQIDTGSEVLRSAGAVADEKTPDGTITRRVGYIDLGTLSWSYNQANMGIFTSQGLADTAKAFGNNIICAKYYTMTTTITGGNVSTWDGWVRFNAGGTGNFSDKTLMIRDTAYTDAATFKTAMSGVYLFYELATPTTEQGTAFAKNIPCDDFGSLYWTNTKGIPQGNEIFYPVDYKASIDTLYNRVDGDMSRIVIDDDLADYNTKAEDESKFATKDALGGTLRQLLAVSKSINFKNTTYVDMGTLDWGKNPTANGHWRFSVNVADIKAATSVTQSANILSSKYITGSANDTWGGTTCVAVNSGDSTLLFACDESYATATEFQAAMKGVLLAYEKASS